MKISVVLPVYNEAQNIPILIDELRDTFREMGTEYEIIAVDDGSHDDSFSILKSIAEKDLRVKVLSFPVNTGQTAALSAGITYATGELIISMDSDLENDPKDIPRLVAKLSEGYDVVSGWRKNRWQNSFLSRKLPSVVANWLISKITGLHLHDFGCILKVYKREAVEYANLYGEMHRFIPAYAYWRGAKVTEVPVTYRPRLHGTSNYGFGRLFKVLLDLVVLKFLDKYMNKPVHFFGGLGFISLGIGLMAGIFSVILKILHARDFVETPLPVFSALFIIVGVQMVAMGIIAEMLMRTYYESQNKKPYIIKDKINLK